MYYYYFFLPFPHSSYIFQISCIKRHNLIESLFLIHSRLRHDKNGGAWCPKHMVGNDGHEYIEVNLHDLHIVTGVQLQGRFGNGLGQEYAEEIVVDFWRPGFTKWRRWKGRNGKEVSF